MDFVDRAPQRPSCRYFFSQGGCRFGSECRFSHETRGNSQWQSHDHHFSFREFVSSYACAGVRGSNNSTSSSGGGESERGVSASYDAAASRASTVGDLNETTITVMSYNVLADAYANKHRRELYTRVPTTCLSWKNRVELLVQEVGHWRPTIVCMQEVDHFRDLEIKLEAQGYVGRFLQRTNDRPDGLAMFWKVDVFGREPVVAEEVMFAGLNLRDNVAQVYRLRMVSGRGGGRDDASDNPFELVVSNIHVLFNPKRGDIKLGQVRVLVDRIAQESQGGAIPVIMCGDWNSAPFSGVYDFVSNGRLDFMERDRRTVSGQIAGNRAKSVNSNGTGSSTLYKAPKPWKIDEIATALGDPMLSFGADMPSTAVLSHDMDLTSSYKHVLGSEPQFTTAHDKYIGTVDYIFFSSSPSPSLPSPPSSPPSSLPGGEERRRGKIGRWHIEPQSVLLPPPTSAVLPQGLPRNWFGSDHISLLVSFCCSYK